MKILYITFENHNNINAWSGMMLNVAHSLELNNNEIVYFDDIKLSFLSKVRIALQILLDKITKKNTKYLRIPSVMKDMTRKIQKRVNLNDFDVIFTMRPHLISYVEATKPIVVFADCNFQSMVNYYGSFSRLREKHIAECNKQEKLAFEKCNLGLFTSPWAMTTSSKNYNIPSNKFKCVYIGSNMSIKHSSEDVLKFINNRVQNPQKRILFVGVDWERKGGNIAVESVYLLNKMGYNCKLVVIGCNPPIKSDYLPYVEIVGRVNKSDKDGLERLDSEYSKAFCFILPTKSECAAVSLAESSSYGLYSFTSNTGGTDGVVFDGINGDRLSVDDGPEKYANAIKQLLDDEILYKRLSIEARKTFESTLNWNSVGYKISEFIKSVFAND